MAIRKRLKGNYRWSNKSFEAIVKAETFGKWLTKLPDQNPETIVDAAASVRSPAHKLFQWNDSIAAREFRLVRARVLLGSFVIETEITSEKNEVSTIDVPYVTRSAPGKYEITTEAMKVSKKRDFILQEALAELRRLRVRYAHLSELAAVFAEVKKVEKQTLCK